MPSELDLRPRALAQRSACARTSASASASRPAAPGHWQEVRRRQVGLRPQRRPGHRRRRPPQGRRAASTACGCCTTTRAARSPTSPRSAKAPPRPSAMYCDLVKEGAPMGVLDIGGGMAVDYDGSHTNFHVLLQLLGPGILHRHRRGRSAGLRQGRGRPSRTSSPRVRPRGRRLLLGAGLQHPRRHPRPRPPTKPPRRPGERPAEPRQPDRRQQGAQQEEPPGVLQRRRLLPRPDARPVLLRQRHPARARPRRGMVLAHPHPHLQAPRKNSTASPRTCANCPTRSSISTTATSRCSSRCPTPGRSTSSSR